MKAKLWAFVVLGLALVGTLVYLMNVPRVSVSGLRAQIEAELPLGTHREKVEAWLEARGIEWFNISTMDGKIVGLGAQIENVYRLEILCGAEIDFAFDFDENGGLRKASVEEHLICL